MDIDDIFRQSALHILQKYVVNNLRYFTMLNIFIEIVVLEKQASYLLQDNSMCTCNLNVYCK